jgi:SAM-dependent methyltransferase
MRVLDLGCGDGLTPGKLGLPGNWDIIGLDINLVAVAKARRSFPGRKFICCASERLPFPACSFERVICNVALPYMNIPRALDEVHRILIPGGKLLASLHPASFTFSELRQVSLRRPKAVLYRLRVVVDGAAFHLTGRSLGESFQTERGMRIALRRAKLEMVSFSQDSKRWFVEASKAEAPAALGLTA